MRTHLFPTALLGCAAAFLLLLPGADAAPVRARLVPAAARKAAPGFDLVDSSGKHSRQSDYHGQVALVNLWATECGGCVLEIPAFVQLHEVYKGRGLRIVGISMDMLYEDLKDSAQAWNKVKPFVAARHIPYQILMGDNEVTERYQVEALPATYLLDRNGRVAATYIGVVDKADLESNIKTVLAEGQ